MTPSAPPDTDSVPGRLQALLAQAAPGAPHGAARAVEVIETHMSWVFLVGEQVFKLKKPVRYPFLDFSTLAAREAACREELRLNARLAPGVYLGLVVLQQRDGRFSLVAEADAVPGRTIDWLVQMRRLPRERMLDRALAAGGVGPAQIDALVAVLAAFYNQAPRVTLDPAEHLARFQREQAASREVLLRPQFQLLGAARALDRFDQALLGQRAALQARVTQRCIVDGHGDLRPEHVCLLQPPVVIDCIEFKPALREVDPFDELAFLALECSLAGAQWAGDRLVAGCAAALADPPPPPLMHLYTAARALLRARLAMAHLLDLQPRTPARWPPLAQRYVDGSLAALDALDASLDMPATITPSARRCSP